MKCDCDYNQFGLRLYREKCKVHERLQNNKLKRQVDEMHQTLQVLIKRVDRLEFKTEHAGVYQCSFCHCETWLYYAIGGLFCSACGKKYQAPDASKEDSDE